MAYIGIGRLHGCVSISKVREWLTEFGFRHLAKMRVKDVPLRDIIETNERDNLKDTF